MLRLRKRLGKNFSKHLSIMDIGQANFIFMHLLLWIPKLEVDVLRRVMEFFGVLLREMQLWIWKLCDNPISYQSLTSIHWYQMSCHLKDTLLSTRNLVFSRILANIIKLRSQFPEHQIKTLRVDGAGEFTSKTWFLLHHRHWHTIPCPIRPFPEWNSSIPDQMHSNDCKIIINAYKTTNNSMGICCTSCGIAYPIQTISI